MELPASAENKCKIPAFIQFVQLVKHYQSVEVFQPVLFFSARSLFDHDRVAQYLKTIFNFIIVNNVLSDASVLEREKSTKLWYLLKHK